MKERKWKGGHIRKGKTREDRRRKTGCRITHKKTKQDKNVWRNSQGCLFQGKTTRVKATHEKTRKRKH